MPYITQEDREKFISYLEKFADSLSNEELTWIFIQLGFKFVGYSPAPDTSFALSCFSSISTMPEFNIGDMNFMMTWLIHKAVVGRGLRYFNLNDLVQVYDKALEKFLEVYENDAVEGCYRCSQAEFIRRIVVPYENKKIKENGAVSDLERELNPED